MKFLYEMKPAEIAELTGIDYVRAILRMLGHAPGITTTEVTGSDWITVVCTHAAQANDVKRTLSCRVPVVAGDDGVTVFALPYAWRMFAKREAVKARAISFTEKSVRLVTLAEGKEARVRRSMVSPTADGSSVLDDLRAAIRSSQAPPVPTIDNVTDIAVSQGYIRDTEFKVSDTHTYVQVWAMKPLAREDAAQMLWHIAQELRAHGMTVNDSAIGIGVIGAVIDHAGHAESQAAKLSNLKGRVEMDTKVVNKLLYGQFGHDYVNILGLTVQSSEVTGEVLVTVKPEYASRVQTLIKMFGQSKRVVVTDSPRIKLTSPEADRFHSLIDAGIPAYMLPEGMDTRRAADLNPEPVTHHTPNHIQGVACGHMFATDPTTDALDRVTCEDCRKTHDPDALRVVVGD